MTVAHHRWGMDHVGQNHRTERPVASRMRLVCFYQSVVTTLHCTIDTQTCPDTGVFILPGLILFQQNYCSNLASNRKPMKIQKHFQCRFIIVDIDKFFTSGRVAFRQKLIQTQRRESCFNQFVRKKRKEKESEKRVKAGSLITKYCVA